MSLEKHLIRHIPVTFFHSHTQRMRLVWFTETKETMGLSSNLAKEEIHGHFYTWS